MSQIAELPKRLVIQSVKLNVTSHTKPPHDLIHQMSRSERDEIKARLPSPTPRQIGAGVAPRRLTVLAHSQSRLEHGSKLLHAATIGAPKQGATPVNYEVDFLPVGEGSGDAIVVRYGDDTDGYLLHVVDGGRSDTADTIVNHLSTYYPGYYINHMVLSHADDDHATGLIGVMEKIDVKNLWMNRPWLYADQILHHFHGNFTLQGLIDDIKRRHPYLVELEQLCDRKRTVIHEVFQGDQIGGFTVLAPTRSRYIDAIPDFGKTPDRFSTEAAGLRSFGLLRSLAAGARKLLESWDIETLAENTETSASNESCVVQYAVLGEKPVLLTADVGPIGLTEAANYAAQRGMLMPKFVQVPHHGSRHNVTPSVLNTWLGKKQPQGTVVGTAFCSVGSNKEEYPRAQVTNAFMRRGFKVYSTRTKWLSHYNGPGHPNMVAAVPEDFEHEVEGL